MRSPLLTGVGALVLLGAVRAFTPVDTDCIHWVQVGAGPPPPPSKTPPPMVTSPPLARAVLVTLYTQPSVFVYRTTKEVYRAVRE